MSQGIVCGFCLKSMDLSEERGRLEPVSATDSCCHSFHYLCLVSSLLTGEIKGQSNCPWCNQMFRRILPLPSGQTQQEELTTIIIQTPLQPTTTVTTQALLPSTESITTAPAFNNWPTPPSPTSSSVALTNGPLSLDNSPSTSIPCGPSSSPPPPPPPSPPSIPTKKPRKKKLKPCIFRDEATTKIAAPPKVKLFGQPFALTCQICRSVHKNRMEKTRCATRHMGPYPCPLCGVQPFKLHSSMRAHHLSTLGIQWKATPKNT